MATEEMGHLMENGGESFSRLCLFPNTYQIVSWISGCELFVYSQLDIFFFVDSFIKVDLSSNRGTHIQIEVKHDTVIPTSINEHMHLGLAYFATGFVRSSNDIEYLLFALFIQVSIWLSVADVVHKIHRTEWYKYYQRACIGLE